MTECSRMSKHFEHIFSFDFSLPDNLESMDAWSNYLRDHPIEAGMTDKSEEHLMRSCYSWGISLAEIEWWQQTFIGMERYRECDLSITLL